jgi:hypothetical protein
MSEDDMQEDVESDASDVDDAGNANDVFDEYARMTDGNFENRIVLFSCDRKILFFCEVVLFYSHAKTIENGFVIRN